MGMNPAGSVQASARLTINQPSEFREIDETFFQMHTVSFVIFLKYLLIFIGQ